MDEQQPRMPDPKNAVLRGGPFDGEQISASERALAVRVAGQVRHVYRPTAELDDEFPTLLVYVHDRTLIY